MNTGQRKHKQARLRVVVCEGLPEDMRDGTREIVGLSSRDRGKGHATALLHKVCHEADADGIVLVLIPKAFSEGMDDTQLSRFYTRFGFEIVQTEPIVLMARKFHVKPQVIH